MKLCLEVQMKNAVVYVSDFNDRRFLFQSMASLRAFDKDIPVFVVVDSTDVDLNTSRLLRKYNASLVEISPFIRGKTSVLKLDPRRRWRRNVLYRLFIPYMEQLKDFDRVLYVDTDTIFFRDFKFLFDLEYSHFYGLFYQKSHTVPYERQKHLYSTLGNAYAYARRNCHNIELRHPIPFYNSGVVMFNNGAIRRDIEKWNAIIDEYMRVFDCKIFPQYDQLFLNIFSRFDEYASNEWDVNTTTFGDKTVIGHFYGTNSTRIQRLLLMKARLSVHNPQLFKVLFDSSIP